MTGLAGETHGEANSLPNQNDRAVCDLFAIPAMRDYLNRIGARPRSMLTAAVTEQEGQYQRDVAVIRLNKANGSIVVKAGTDGYEPTEAEAAAIASAVMAGIKWPEPLRLHKIINPHPIMASAAPDDLFEFRDADNKLIMVQVRTAEKSGSKQYRPFTYFDDGEWRCMEPEGLLPLWGIPQLHHASTVCLHEGAKAARYCARMVAGETRQEKEKLAAHPWGQQLAGAAHLGWIGGARSPHRTDWSVLQNHGISRVYVVNDNDVAGREAVPTISRALAPWDIAVENICVSEDKFPATWDLADPMPTDGNGEYIGEPMMSYSVPATWLTRTVLTGEKGRPAHVLRRVVTQLIVPIRDQECFGYMRNGVIRQAGQLNKAQAPFSDVDDSARLFWKDYAHGSVDGLTYCPAERSRIVQEGDRRCFNTYTPSPIEGDKADLTEWQEYLAYMFPVERDRREVERWVATLIGRPDIRMTFSLLLISTRQGKGKSTMLDVMLRPLVGTSNSALVKSNDMKSGFNGWAAGRRLVVCHEIYEGRNKALAESLKSVMTDERISINEKYEKPYELPNWTVIAACSNSRRAVHIDNKDRRWFIPDIDENTLWQRDRFARFRTWLRAGGLRAIKYWAEHYESEFGGNYARSGEHAPMSAAKLVSIEENLSEGARAVLEMAEALAGYEVNLVRRPAAVAYPVLWAKARTAMKGCPDTDAELLAVAESVGLTKFIDSAGGDRIKVGGLLRRFLVNEAGRGELANCNEGPETERGMIRDWAKAWLSWWQSQGSEM